MNDWKLKPEDNPYPATVFVSEAGMAARHAYEVGYRDGQAKLVRWGEEECDKHTETYGASRFDCNKCRRELCRELGVQND